MNKVSSIVACTCTEIQAHVQVPKLLVGDPNLSCAKGTIRQVQSMILLLP